MEFLTDFDRAGFYAVNVEWKSPFFDIIMPFVTNLNNWIFFIAIFLIYIIYIDKKKALVTIALAILAVSVSDLINHNVLKSYFARQRPCNVLEGIYIMAGCTSSYAFPSSHASNVFALCAILSFRFSRFAYVLIPIALTVCYSRVYLGVHYPLDVTVGAIAGTFYSICLILLYLRLVKPKFGI